MLHGEEGNNMKITEMFKSIEGEGIRTGRIATFIRTFGCPCRCVFCDSMYSNEVTAGVEIKDLTVSEIVDYCKEQGTPYVTLTGGEPLVQPEMLQLIEELLDEGFEVNVETSGAVDIGLFKKALFTSEASYLWDKLIFTVDYKSISSGANHQMIVSNFTESLDSWDVVKFVVGTNEDLDDMKRVVDLIKESYSSEDLPHIFVSPVFGSIEPSDIVEYIKNNNMFDVRMQLQIHKYIWDFNARGV